MSANCFAHCVTDKVSNVCVTAGCVNAAADVLDMMDPTVGPCEDFYNFACGQFLNRTVLSDEKVSIDTFSISRDHMQSQLYQLIDAPIQPNESRYIDDGDMSSLKHFPILSRNVFFQYHFS